MRPLDPKDASSYEAVWARVEARLDQDLPAWRDRIQGWGQVAAADNREQGVQLGDSQVFRGIVLSVLSNNTNWERVEQIKVELDDLFFGFSMERYSRMPLDEVDRRLVPWFTRRRAGSMTLRPRLGDLVVAAQKLTSRAASHGSAEAYLTHLFELRDRDPKQLALGLATEPTKLNGLGVPLAAEALKNIGYDVAKPDRHVNRAVAAFGWVQFKKWGNGLRDRFAAPVATSSEMLDVMTVLEAWASSTGQRVTLIDNAVWLLCADSGLHLKNAELQAEIGRHNPERALGR